MQKPKQMPGSQLRWLKLEKGSLWSSLENIAGIQIIFLYMNKHAEISDMKRCSLIFLLGRMKRKWERNFNWKRKRFLLWPFNAWPYKWLNLLADNIFESTEWAGPQKGKKLATLQKQVGQDRSYCWRSQSTDRREKEIWGVYCERESKKNKIHRKCSSRMFLLLVYKECNSDFKMQLCIWISLLCEICTQCYSTFIHIGLQMFEASSWAIKVNVVLLRKM